MMKRSDGEYVGLAVDIYRRVADELLKENVSLNLTFQEVDAYGSRPPNGEWTGAIGKLKERHRGRVSYLIFTRSTYT